MPASPSGRNESTNPLGLPQDCFAAEPGKRLNAMRQFLSSLSGSELSSIQELVMRRYRFEHCAYAIPAWGLIVLPGPGAGKRGTDEGNPYDPYCDWTPGLGQPSRHLREYPDYLHQTSPVGLLRREPTDRGGRMWPNVRGVLLSARLPGVSANPGDRLACWGLVNLTTEHSRTEAMRRPETQWSTEPLREIIRVCRPCLVATTAGIADRVHALLAEERLTPEDEERVCGIDGRHSFSFRWWTGAGSKIRVGKILHPARFWQGDDRVSSVLKAFREETRLIVGSSGGH